MIDFAPPPIEFPKPAIIQPAPAELLAYGRDPMAAMLPGIMPVIAGGAPLQLTYANGATSITQAITIPSSGVAVGDIAVLLDWAINGSSVVPTTAIPSGWTSLVNINNASGNRVRITASCGVLGSGDPGSSINGMTAQFTWKVMFVFNPSKPITSFAGFSWNAEISAGDPTAQVVDVTGQTDALLILGASATLSATGAFSTASPAFDATLATSNGRMLGGRKIYNSSAASHTIDMGNLSGSGNGNGLFSGGIAVA